MNIPCDTCKIFVLVLTLTFDQLKKLTLVITSKRKSELPYSKWSFLVTRSFYWYMYQNSCPCNLGNLWSRPFVFHKHILFRFCLFVFCFSFHSRIFHRSFGDVTIAGEGLYILTCARHLCMVIEQ